MQQMLLTRACRLNADVPGCSRDSGFFQDTHSQHSKEVPPQGVCTLDIARGHSCGSHGNSGAVGGAQRCAGDQLWSAYEVVRTPASGELECIPMRALTSIGIVLGFVP